MRWWQKEVWRQIVPTAPALLGLLVPGESVLKSLAAWDIYAIGYLGLTWLTYRRRDSAGLREVSRHSRPPRGLGWRLVTTSPDRLPQAAGAVALVAAVVVMPRAQQVGAPPGLAFGVCVIAVAGSWLMLQTGYAMSYAAAYLDGGGLRFPGEEKPLVGDFAYFAVAVGTSFGTTDVDVTTSRMRRLVMSHNILAFVFNTLIVAIAVAALTSFLAR